MTKTILKLTAQQEALLRAINDAKGAMPTNILYDVRVRCADMFKDYLTSNPRAPRSASDTYRIGDTAGKALARLRDRGMVESTSGTNCLDWTITEIGQDALEAYQRPSPLTR